MIQTVCDRCGRTGNSSTHATITLLIEEEEFPDRTTERHFCQDPDGGTVGCFRKVRAEMLDTLNKKKGGDLWD